MFSYSPPSLKGDIYLSVDAGGVEKKIPSESLPSLDLQNAILFPISRGGERCVYQLHCTALKGPIYRRVFGGRGEGDQRLSSPCRNALAGRQPEALPKEWFRNFKSFRRTGRSCHFTTLDESCSGVPLPIEHSVIPMTNFHS
ncbi:hypothetical protein CEXT_211431 [Caerostris extrusa]|uniref:Uncharacterized protein n=1 Tax=Caerostris extrusa TaxID=172846 RepID=A0AAV4QDB9_CAEEX|nr:hypothetical protein CEXT_211431 [Caerostris extrusa]